MISHSISAELNLVLFEKHPNFLFFIYRCTFIHDTVSSLIGIDCVLTVFACFCVAALSMQILKPAGFVETSHYPLLLLVYVQVDVVTQVDEEQQCFHSQRRFKTYWSRDTLLRPFSSWMLNARPPVHPVISIMFLSLGLFGCPSLCSSNLSFSLCLRIPNHNSLNVVYQSDREHCAASASVDFPSWIFKLCTQGLFEKHTGFYSAVLIVQRLCIRAATGLPVARWWRSSSTWTGPRCWWAASAPSWCAATDEAAASRAPTCCTASRRSWECTRSRTRRTLSSTSHVHHGFFNIIEHREFTVDSFLTVLSKHHWCLFRHTSMLGRV